jgi:hypothetical protein
MSKYSICRWCGREYPGENFYQVCGEKCKREWLAVNPGADERIGGLTKRYAPGCAMVSGAVTLVGIGIHLVIWRTFPGPVGNLEIFIIILPGVLTIILLQQWWKAHMD